jgi:malate dehydrogenase (oxaloacetate-decarboxylating)
MTDYYQGAVELHKRLKGKLKIQGKELIKNIDDMSMLYTPGVAQPCREIAKDKKLAYDLTVKHNTVAIVSDGTRVLGLGDIGPEAALPVMEGKALIMQQFGGIDAFPICLDTKDEDEIVRTVKAIAPVFGAINLEDIETPKVFEIERRLTEELDIPVFHDDQHGTAVVVLAGLINAMKLTGIGKSASVAVVGAGAAGYGIVKLLVADGFSNLVVFDSKGAIHEAREGLNEQKEEIARITNQDRFVGSLAEFSGSQIIIAATKPGALPIETIQNMKKPNIVFALSNPTSEISLEQARELGVDVFGSGRSDYPNQINNSLCFPGFLRALLDLRITKITDGMKIAAAKGIAESIPENEISKDKIVPDAFNEKIKENILQEVKKAIV